MKAAERFVFLIFRISRQQANLKNNDLYRRAYYYYRELEHEPGKVWEIEDLIEEIEWYIEGEDEEYYHGYLDFERFYDYIEGRFRGEGGTGFYGWNALKYFLYEYELHLQASAKGPDKVTWGTVVDSESIEHILPAEWSKKDCWKKNFKNFPKKQQKLLLHSFGNLLLLSQSKNSELQNECFDYKKKHEDKSGNKVGYFNGSYSEIEVNQYSDWTPQDISDRGIKLLEFMEQRWDIEIENKEKILFLDFLSNA